MTITWDEVLSGTDLVDELVPPSMPKLKALFSQPTVFDESTNFRGVRHPVGPEPLRSRPQTDAEAVFDAHLARTEPHGTLTEILEDAGFGARIYDGLEIDGRPVEPIHAEASLYANHRDTPSLEPADDEELTDAERRERAAELFGIDPSTMTEDRLEGLQ